jgi:DNA-binding NtrC family response regulator
VLKLKRVSDQLLERWRRSNSAKLKASPMPRLLVVDDEDSIRFSMQEYFSYNGFEVDTAGDLEEAEKLIEACSYKVLIQDLRMGATKYPNGLRIVQLMHQRNPETRIVVLTAYGSPEVENEAKDLGADAFLKKPQPLSQVAQVVRGLIESPRKRAKVLG